jgi:hypothetical protein
MCPGCSAAITLAEESKETVQKTMDAFAKVQAGLSTSLPNDKLAQ